MEREDQTEALIHIVGEDSDDDEKTARKELAG